MTLELILFVDDDANALAAYQRTLRKAFDVQIATGGEAGLKALAGGERFAAIVSDMHMPQMDGIEFLSRARAIAPDATRVMLTGADDQRTAADAVNRGSIFRFLAKPCTSEQLAETIVAAVRQHRLITAERDLLEKTLGGAMRVLVEILAVVDPESFGRSAATRDLARALCAAIKAAPTWELDVAALLAPIGIIAIPPQVLVKMRSGQVLAGPEKDMVQSMPRSGSDLLANIPRLEGVARVVLYQDKRWDGGGFPVDDVAGDAIPLEARILRVAMDIIAAGGLTQRKAIAALRERPGAYDPAIVAAAEGLLPPAAPDTQREVTAGQLMIGMILAADVRTNDGTILIGSGVCLTQALIERLRNFTRLCRVAGPLLVRQEAAA